MNQLQGRKLREVGYRLPFTKCVCEAHSVYRMYHPQRLGYELWCYVCGRKDSEIRGKQEQKVSMPLDDRELLRRYKEWVRQHSNMQLGDREH